MINPAMERTDMCTFDGIENDTVSLERSKKGVYISPLALIIYILVTLFLAAAVGLIVHFAHPCDPCPVNNSQCATLTLPETTKSPTAHAPVTSGTAWSLDEDELWSKCKNMSLARNECLPGALPCPYDIPYEDMIYFLPQTFRPKHYTLEIIPDIYTQDPPFPYTGTVTIYLVCTENSDVIYLHFHRMAIDEPIEVKCDSEIIGVNRTNTESATNFLKIYLDRTVVMGQNISVTLNYHGVLNLDMVGMYYSDYEYENETKYMLATQFEATDARKAFPCMDEPSLKATFEVTLWRKEPMRALTNMPLVSSENKSNGWIADYFGVTPVVMPTYLLAFAIADYSHIEGTTKGGLTSKKLRHWSRPDYIANHYIDYSLDVCLTMFDYFEEYFDFPYAMPKEDQISIPDFDSGAMENWGLITYREARMVYDPDHVTFYEMQGMTGTLAHELLHQWLGNVVTCAWWDDLWLNEGMARYHQHLAMEAAQPSWDIKQLFAAQVVYRAFSADQLSHSSPVYNPVYEKSEIESMFNSITYDKGGCIIRMINKLVLGDSSYHEAMKEYVRTYAYSVATRMDLLRMWDEQAIKDNIELDVNITMVTMTWIMQMGYPVVTMERLDDATVKLTQKMFLQIPERPFYERYPSPYNYAWEIPVSYVTSKNHTEMHIEWMHTDNRTITLPLSLTNDDWLLGNYMQYGFYRVNYDTKNWDALIKQLTTNHTVFDVTNRGQLIHDSFNLGRMGDIDHAISLRLTEYLSEEADYLPWHAAADHAFVFFKKILRYSGDYFLFRKYVAKLLQKNYDRLGWVRRPGDTDRDVYLRDLVLTHSCMNENQDCIRTALDYFRRWQQDPTNATIIPPDLRDAVYCTAIYYGQTSDWDFLFEQYATFIHFSNEKYRRRRALSCSNDRPTLTKLFKLAANNDPSITSHDPSGSTSILRDLAKGSVGHYIGWEALNMYWDILPGRLSVLASVCDAFSTDFDLIKYDTFVTNNPTKSHFETGNFEDMRDIIVQNIEWRSANEDRLFKWLRYVV